MKIASVLSKEQDVEQYSKLANKIRAAINQVFFHPTTGTYASGTQCEQAFALYFGICDQSSEETVLQSLLDQIKKDEMHFTTGMFGTKYLLSVLNKFGFVDVAKELVAQTTYPSYGYMLSRGATTLWEVWNWSDNVYSHNQ